jgi:hypothetical protein
MMSHFDYISSHCTQGSPVFCPNTERPVATTAPAPNKLDPSARMLPRLWRTLIAGVPFDYTQSRRVLS